MSTFGPDPEHRFAFGLRSIADEAVEPWEFVYRLGDLGAWGVGFHDDDLVPAGASPSERHDVVDRVAKALDSTGMVVSMLSANVSGRPEFAHGAYTSVDRDVRRYAIQKAMRALDLGAELGVDLHELSLGAETTDSLAAKPPLDALDRCREAVDFVCAYACDQGYQVRFALRCDAHDSQGETMLPTIGHALAFAGTLDRPEMVGLGPTIVPRASTWRRVPRCGPDDRRRQAPQHPSQRRALQPRRHRPGVRRERRGRCLRARQAARRVRLRRPAALRHRSGLLRRPARCGTSPSVACAPTGRWPPRPSGSPTTPRSATPSPPAATAELAEPSVGPFSAEAGRALSTERFDPAELVQRRYRNPRLDQLVVDLVLGLR